MRIITLVLNYALLLLFIFVLFGTGQKNNNALIGALIIGTVIIITLIYVHSTPDKTKEAEKKLRQEIESLKKTLSELKEDKKQ